MRARIFRISFVIMFLLTAFLCIVSKQPLFLSPIKYSFFSFIELAIVICIFCFLLAYITLPLLNIFKPSKPKSGRFELYFLFTTLPILQAVTLFFGYLESSLGTSTGGDLFFYYRGVTNSWIYIISGNITASIAASLYANYQLKKKKETKETNLQLN